MILNSTARKWAVLGRKEKPFSAAEQVYRLEGNATGKLSSEVPADPGMVDPTPGSAFTPHHQQTPKIHGTFHPAASSSELTLHARSFLLVTHRTPVPPSPQDLAAFKVLHLTSKSY